MIPTTTEPPAALNELVPPPSTLSETSDHPVNIEDALKMVQEMKEHPTTITEQQEERSY